MAIDASKLRHGRVRGRYFRENFAQAGIDLSQIIPELVTNADAAIAAAGRGRGRIQLRIGRADPEFLHAWKAALRSLRLPALYRNAFRCTRCSQVSGPLRLPRPPIDKTSPCQS